TAAFPNTRRRAPPARAAEKPKPAEVVTPPAGMIKSVGASRKRHLTSSLLVRVLLPILTTARQSQPRYAPIAQRQRPANLPYERNQSPHVPAIRFGLRPELFKHRGFFQHGFVAPSGDNE